MGMKELKYIGPFLRIETGEKGSKVDRCPCPENCPNDIGQNCCSMCGKPLAERYQIFTEPFPNPDVVLIETYGESLLSVLTLKRSGRYIIFAISNRAFNEEEPVDVDRIAKAIKDDGSVREINDMDVTSERRLFEREFASEIGALHLAGAKVSVLWGEITYWS